MKLVINRAWGGFGLSYDAVMLYAKLSGFTLYAFVEKRDKHGNLKWGEFEPYRKGTNPFTIHYVKSPLDKNGHYAEDDYFSERDIPRDDLNLVKVVEQLGEKANDNLSSLKIIEIPDGTDWQIDDYDGMETVEEKHQSWT